jgi:hypothetical protein
LEDRKLRKNETTNDLFTAARELLGGSLSSTIAHTFRCMEIGEEEIAAAKARHPLLAAQLHDGFRELCPPPVLRDAGERLYRAYCREMLTRIVAGSPPGAATTAELLAVLQAMSLAAPLERAATVLYWDRFAETFPADADRLRSEIGFVAADSYDQVRAKELETKLRRQLTRARAADRA